MIQLENVSFKYKKKQVFDNFSLSFEQGKIYGLLGKNGAGKSTLLYLMTGLLIPQKGKVLFNYYNVSKRTPAALQEIFIVPEEFDLPKISLKRYVAINKPFYPNFSEQELEENLRYFDLDMTVNLGELSLGQKKKVYMCFALAANTSLLIMDEPTNGLDIPGKSQFKKFIASRCSEDRTIIISTHQVQDVEKLIDHVLIVEDNTVYIDASVDDICKKLKFVEGETLVDQERAIYVLPTIKGCSALYPNDNEEESELNLEILFNALLNNREGINKLFNL
ncbi:ABC-2 type transport system ATP-binding protein [Dysgonomonadaceae bacterium PH5-43]|nr:ABC-2 type transport system ATP-binding protein [Dysgonomonadaceae bacterium PH5-43]